MIVGIEKKRNKMLWDALLESYNIMALIDPNTPSTRVLAQIAWEHKNSAVLIVRSRLNWGLRVCKEFVNAL